MNIYIKKIDHIQICVPKGSEDEARKFYSEILGLEEIEKPNELKASGGVWFKAGDIELHLGVEENTVKTKSHPAFEIESASGGIDEVEKFLKENDIKLKEEIQIPGRKRFSFYDPFGNRIELLEYL